MRLRRWRANGGCGAFGALLLSPSVPGSSPHGEDTAYARELRAAGRRCGGGAVEPSVRSRAVVMAVLLAVLAAPCDAACVDKLYRLIEPACSYYADQGTEGTTDFNYCKPCGPNTEQYRPFRANCCYTRRMGTGWGTAHYEPPSPPPPLSAPECDMSTCAQVPGFTESGATFFQGASAWRPSSREAVAGVAGGAVLALHVVV